jgi:hypothetical protein
MNRGRATQDDVMEFLILAAIIGMSFGLGYGVRELVSRQRRHRRRHRHSRRDWPGEAVPSPNPELPNPKPDRRPVEPAGEFAIDLDRLQIAANDDRAGRDQRSQDGRRVDPEIRRDELDVAARDLLAELNRLSSDEGASPRPANFQRLG